MATAAETLNKATEIIRTELTKRLHGSPRVHQVSARNMLAGDDEFIHVVVIFDGERQGLDPKTLNVFDQEIEPMLMEIGIHPVPAISYINRNEVVQWSDIQSVQPQD